MSDITPEQYIAMFKAQEEIVREMSRLRKAFIDMEWSDAGAEQAAMLVMQTSVVAGSAQRRPKKAWGR